MFDFHGKTPAEVYSEVKKLLPHKISKKIDKTADARTGTGIYKRRNRRNYRAIMQYSTWNKIKNGDLENILPQYASGYAILISPSEYFGDNYPNPSNKLNNEFKLGVNGFVYYTLVSEYNQFPPIPEWKEVIEFSTKSSITEPNWKGEYALNIKNSKPSKLSLICYDAKKAAKDQKKTDVSTYVKEKYLGETVSSNFPEQCGLGNYDYDYASPEMQAKVELQMLLLLLSCTTQDGSTFPQYVINNKEDILEPGPQKDKPRFVDFVNDTENYTKKFNEMYQELVRYCSKELDLLNYTSLQKISAVNSNKQTICPLCRKPLYLDEFFGEILQAEGRQVQDNTQREIVLMHITALRSGFLNHRCYNLGWGHHYCNLIQGDKSLDETISELRRILTSFDELS